ncbi:hypothetical protein KIK84_06930 [Curvibacter sp. CHRR-16]|uniref:hypothetical protein n=1 Tax=Curvibacter sp. CHRR-16 TaxID=2835872 RepID=UPI001BDB304F|nr:hypothetical protein [Curvibacter sp. CHRR-16]MBT0570051.1 hypothetical protein [Curvibacter sp. CHRR-16]
MTSATETEDTTTQATASIETTLQFIGLDGLPIEGLTIRSTVDGKTEIHKTDAQGFAPALQAEAGADVQIEVQRIDGSYKLIDQCKAPATPSNWTYTSPAMVFEVTAELHQGQPGNAQSLLPQWSEADLGVLELAKPDSTEPPQTEPPVSEAYRQEGHNHPEQKVQAQPKPQATASNTSQTKQLSTKQQPDPARAAPAKTGAKAPIETGRDAKGNPLMVYTEKVKNWWGSWSFPWPTAAHAQPTTNQAVSSKPVAYVGEMQKQVQALIDTATALTGRIIDIGSDAYLSQAKNGTKTLEDFSAKPSKDSLSWCYKYVKIALVQSNVTAKAPAGESASTAGPELVNEKLGFSDVTAQVPDARWAAAGDVIVYRWTEATWQKRNIKEATKQLASAKADVGKTEKQALAAAKAAQQAQDAANKNPSDTKAKAAAAKAKAAADKAKAKAEAAPAKVKSASEALENAKEGKGDKVIPNHGHIEIRSYDGYISDYIHVACNAKEYDAPRIYRKVFDPMPTVYIKALLHCLREYECTDIKDEDRYSRLNYPLPSNPQSFTFNSYKKHPWADVESKPAAIKEGKASTAAGAYQITVGTWQDIFDRYWGYIPGNAFTSLMQDILAVAIIEDVDKEIKGRTLNLIRAGKVEDAVPVLATKWVSLPGGSQNAHRKVNGKPMNMDYFRSIYSQFLAEEKTKAGVK